MPQYIALYRKFRPSVFNDVIGQEQIIKILKHQIQNNQVGHAYLFCGSRGTGKTSTAKIFSRAVNCLSPINGEPCNQCTVCKGILSSAITDVMEIDAASNNSVDNIRSIRENVIYAPALAKYKVYIIDEVHMLSGSAFNALLKTLEEPPENVIFILATTEPHKIPITILSRCQRFEFKRITKNDIAKRLKLICEEIGITISESSLAIISQASEGALRDAISLLDKIISSGVTDITEEITREILGITSSSVTFSVLESILKKDINHALELTSEVINSGKDIKYFVWEIISFARDILVFNTTENSTLVNNYASIEQIKSLSYVPANKLSDIIEYFSELEGNIKTATFPNILLESALIRMISSSFVAPQPSAHVPDTVKLSEASKPDMVKPSEAPTPPAPTVNSPGENNMSEKWSEVIIHLKNSGKMSLYATLISTSAVADDTSITITFSQPFGKTMIEKAENMAVLKNSITVVYGHALSVKCIIKGDNAKKSSLNDLENTLLNSGIDVNIT